MKPVQFKHKKYSIWIDLLSLSGIAIAIHLVANELKEPGYCPSYPVISIPACFLVFVFFLLVFITRFIRQSAPAKILFYTASSMGLTTAVWFSVNHLLNRVHCPVLIGIPLCFAALLTFLALIILGFKGFSDKRDTTTV